MLRRFPARSFLGLVVLATLAFVVSTQIVTPNKRVLEAVAGLILIFLAYKTPPYYSLGFFILFYQFPFGLSIGTSNLIFVPVIFFVWLIRISSGHLSRVRKTILDLPIVLLAIAYILSFYNLPDDKTMMRLAFINTANFAGTIFIYYLCVNFIRDNKSLQLTLAVLTVSCALACAYGVLEILFPGKVFIPNWIVLGLDKFSDVLVVSGMRIVGPFHDYELFAEYLAINSVFILFMLLRVERASLRFLLVLLEALVLFLLFATATRGAVVSLFLGLLVFFWLVRRSIKFHTLVIFLTAVVSVVFLAGYFAENVAKTESLLARMKQTRFEKGIPDTRARAWPEAVERIMEHPILGHSPTWSTSVKGIDAFHWPHNVYLLYWYIGGIAALLAYLYLLFTLFRHARRWKVASLNHPSYSRSVMTILFVVLIMFAIDQIKIDYIRNPTYSYFVWIFFGLIAATTRICAIEEAKVREAVRSTPPEAPTGSPARLEPGLGKSIIDR